MLAEPREIMSSAVPQARKHFDLSLLSRVDLTVSDYDGYWKSQMRARPQARAKSLCGDSYYTAIFKNRSSCAW
jgi:hypothetical protein